MTGVTGCPNPSHPSQTSPGTAAIATCAREQPVTARSRRRASLAMRPTEQGHRTGVVEHPAQSPLTRHRCTARIFRAPPGWAATNRIAASMTDARTTFTTADTRHHPVDRRGEPADDRPWPCPGRHPVHEPGGPRTPGDRATTAGYRARSPHRPGPAQPRRAARSQPVRPECAVRLWGRTGPAHRGGSGRTRRRYRHREHGRQVAVRTTEQRRPGSRQGHQRGRVILRKIEVDSTPVNQ